MTPETFQVLGQMYQHTTPQWVEQLPNISPKMKINAKILGVMRNLLVYGFENSGGQEATQAFLEVAIAQLREFYQLCRWSYILSDLRSQYEGRVSRRDLTTRFEIDKAIFDICF